MGEQPFAVLLADDMMVGPPGGLPVLAQMTGAFASRGHSLLAVQEVPADQVRRYGIVAGTPAGERLIQLERIVEKPAPEDAPSRMGVAGRYILTPRIFDEIRQLPFRRFFQAFSGQTLGLFPLFLGCMAYLFRRIYEGYHLD